MADVLAQPAVKEGTWQRLTDRLLSKLRAPVPGTKCEWNRLSGIPHAEARPCPEADVKAFLRTRATSGAGLKRMNLTAWQLKNCDLSGIDFWSSNLDEVDFGTARVTSASFTDCSLRGADLSKVIGLTDDQLAGADLVNAKLPDKVANFEELKTVEELSKNIGKVILVLFGAVGFALATVGNTKPYNLFLSGGNVKLPVVDGQVSYAVFFVLAPIILLGTYIYLQLYLQRLWDTIVKLPAVFPDGRRLDERSYPWLFNDYGTQYFPRLVGRLPRLHWLQTALYTLVAWWSLPFVMLTFPIQSLCRHSADLTTFHVGLVGLAFWLASYFRSLAVHTLSWEKGELQVDPMAHVRRIVRSGFTFALWQIPTALTAWLAMSCFAIPDVSNKLWSQGFAARVARNALEACGFRFDANIAHVNLCKSAAPADGSSPSADEGPILRRLDLVHGDFRSSVMIAADLCQSNFNWARFNGAKVSKAIINNADFNDADLSYADFSQARTAEDHCSDEDLDLLKAHRQSDHQESLSNSEVLDFEKTFVPSVTFRRALLNDTILRKCEINFGDFSDADMEHTVLLDATVSGSHFERVSVAGVNASGLEAWGTLWSGSIAESNFFKADFGEESKFDHLEAYETDFRKACFDDATIQASQFHQCSLDGASWNGAKIGLPIDSPSRQRSDTLFMFNHGQWRDIGVFSKAQIGQVSFYNCNVYEETFNEAVLDGCRFVDCNVEAIKGAVLKNMNLHEVENPYLEDLGKGPIHLIGCNLSNCKLPMMEDVVFVDCTIDVAPPGVKLPPGLTVAPVSSTLPLRMPNTHSRR